MPRPRLTCRRPRRHGPSRRRSQRGLELLRAFRCEARPLSNRTIAERTGLPKATVSRITSTLVRPRLPNRVASTGRYQLGTGMVASAGVSCERCDHPARRSPLMQQFAARHDMSIGLAVPDRLQMIYMIWCRSPKTLTLRLTAGLDRCRWRVPPSARRISGLCRRPSDASVLERIRKASEGAWSGHPGRDSSVPSTTSIATATASRSRNSRRTPLVSPCRWCSTTDERSCRWAAAAPGSTSRRRRCAGPSRRT